jgi:GntR family transcriptional regulator, galactonate operon transcriptional repressor
MKYAPKTAKGHRLHDYLVRCLATRILRGEPLIPNLDCPTETDLCAEFSVSRTILREAIKVLEAKGFLEVRPKVGVTILPRHEWNVVDPSVLTWQSEILPDKEFIRNLCEFRRAIEPVAAELAARRASKEDAERILACMGRMEATVQNRADFIDADMEFHSTIFAACQNELIQRTSLTVYSALRTSRVITTGRSGSSVASLVLHRDVANAIRAHDPLAARFAMDALISRTALDIEAVLHENLQIENRAKRPDLGEGHSEALPLSRIKQETPA